MQKYIIIFLLIWTGLTGSAQPAVKDEPRHHNVFENEYLRVLDVFLAPNDTTQYHIHNTPSVFISLSKTKTTNQSLGQPINPVNYEEIKAWYDNIPSPRIHRVWNSDTSWLHIMDVELTGSTPQYHPLLIKNAALKLLFDEIQVTGYQLNLDPAKSIQLPETKTGYLLVSLGDANINIKKNRVVQKRVMKVGHYAWIEAGNRVSLTNSYHAASAFAVLHLK
ncbi:MAG: hypothetical protein SH818_11890 [Saprospiraceae bacterium]|nr:hypothetical protein [Saprospiraceae bacterium]